MLLLRLGLVEKCKKGGVAVIYSYNTQPYSYDLESDNANVYVFLLLEGVGICSLSRRDNLSFCWNSLLACLDKSLFSVFTP